MPSSYTSRLRLELQATGENRTTWGTLANNVFSRIDDAIAGTVAVPMANANITLTANNGTSDQARFMNVTLTGANTAIRTVTIPTVSKFYLITNATTGGFAVQVKTSTGTTVAVAPNLTAIVYCDGTNSIRKFDIDVTQLDGQAGSFYSDLTNMTGVLSIAQGGTGGNTAQAARTSLAVPGLGTANIFTGSNTFNGASIFNGTVGFNSTVTFDTLGANQIVVGPGSAAVDGTILMAFATDRQWFLKQRGADASATLSLETTLSKDFQISAEATYAGPVISFRAIANPSILFGGGKGGLNIVRDTSGLSADRVLISSSSSASSADGAWVVVNGVNAAADPGELRLSSATGGVVRIMSGGSTKLYTNATDVHSMVNHAFDLGCTFGSVTAATPQTLTNHIALYGTTYGFSITASTINYITNGTTGSHDFYSGTTFLGRFDAVGAGTAMPALVTDRLRLTSTGDVSDAVADIDFAFQIGPATGSNVRMDTNEILFSNNGVAGVGFINSANWSCGTNGFTYLGSSAGINLTALDATGDPYITFNKTISAAVTRQGYIQHSDGTGAEAGMSLQNDIATGGATRFNLKNTGGIDGLNYRVGSTNYTVLHSGNMTATDVNTALGYTAANAANSVIAGNGLTGGGTLAASRTLTVGTPGSITNSTTNSVTTTSHTHALATTFAEVYTGTGVSDTSFPLGHTVMCHNDGVAIPVRNASATTRLHASYNTVYSTTGSNTALAGTWRMRGGLNTGAGDHQLFNMERVS